MLSRTVDLDHPRRLPVISRVSYQPAMYVFMALFRDSAAFSPPPGRADHLSVLESSTQREMGAEAGTRGRHLEKGFGESSQGK